MKTRICSNCNTHYCTKYHNNVNGKSYCSKKCQQESKWVKHKQLIEEGKVLISTTHRKYLAENFGYKCSCCGISNWNNKPLTLQVDHIDGNPDNNFPINLRLLCPNCHSQTPSYKGGNKNKLKTARRAVFHREMIKH